MAFPVAYIAEVRLKGNAEVRLYLSEDGVFWPFGTVTINVFEVDEDNSS